MISIQLYPVMDGIEVWISGTCSQGTPGHLNHSKDQVHRYMSGEEIAERGVAGAISAELTLALHEFSQIAERAQC